MSVAALFVGVAGFEPTTSSSRTTRATGLRYTPIWMAKLPKLYELLKWSSHSASNFSASTGTTPAFSHT